MKFGTATIGLFSTKIANGTEYGRASMQLANQAQQCAGERTATNTDLWNVAYQLFAIRYILFLRYISSHNDFTYLFPG